MTIETTLAEIRNWAKLSQSAKGFENFIKMHYFKLPASEETPEIIVTLKIKEK